MSESPRTLNRVLLALIGAAVTTAGVLLTLAGLMPRFAEGWQSTVLEWWHTATEADAQSRFSVGSWHTSWMWLTFFALLLALVGLLLSWIFAQGGGKRDVLMRQAGQEGALIVRPEVAAEALKAELDGDPQVVKTSVSAWEARGTPALKVTVQGRKGASPREIADRVERAVSGLDRLLGKQLPVLISINAGARTSWSAQHRVS